MQEQKQSRWDLFLLLSLLLVILMYPLLDRSLLGRSVLGALVFVPGVAATLKLSEMKGRVWPSRVLMSGAVVFGVADYFVPTRTLSAIKWAMLTAFFGLTVVTLFNYLKRATFISQAHLYTAITIYLMMGIQWFALYNVIDIVFPGSFMNTSSVAGVREPELLYFSLVTLSTIGYGDIVPLQGEARMLAALEGIAGVLYIAITVALLVNAYRQQNNST